MGLLEQKFQCDNYKCNQINNIEYYVKINFVTKFQSSEYMFCSNICLKEYLNSTEKEK